MNVTTEINNKRNSMGGSGSSRQAYLAANKSLNLSSAGNNINNASPKLVTAIPVILKSSDSVGLFGPENKFIKLDLNILSSSSSLDSEENEENDYFPATQNGDIPLGNDYFTSKMDFLKDLTSVNLYNPATATGALSDYERPVISIELENIGTGNRFVDNWLDIRLYSPNREPIDGNKLYTDITSDVYIGLHARNTKRLPYNIEIKVGIEYLEYSFMTKEQRELFV